MPFEGAGAVEPWLRAFGAEVTCTRFFESRACLPAVEDVDLLVVMGGPMSVNDEDTAPWLVDEKRFVRQAVERGTRVLGVCLGAQMIASAMGARVFRHAHKEIGWFPVFSTTAETGAGRLAFPNELMAFHWHGETFDLPRGALHLARSAACEHQAFQIGAHVIGLQCHLEFTPDTTTALARHCREELVPSTWVHGVAEILRAEPARYARCHAVLDEVLRFLTRP